jgi:hypothetical protein
LQSLGNGWEQTTIEGTSESSGHALVHYLYTGNYQALRSKEDSPAQRRIADMETSIQVYATARAYQLTRLEELAKSEIERLGRDMADESILSAVKDAYPSLRADDTWMAAYLLARMETLLKTPSALLGTDFLDRFSNPAPMAKILLEAMLRLFCRRMESSKLIDDGAEEPAPKDGPMPEEPMPEEPMPEEPMPEGYCSIPMPKKKKKGKKRSLETMVCELRAEHVTQGDGWKQCIECRDFVRGLSLTNTEGDGHGVLWA